MPKRRRFTDDQENDIVAAYLAGQSMARIGTSYGVFGAVRVGIFPYGLAVNPVTNRIYVTDYDAHTVSVLDATSNEVLATVPVGDGPYNPSVNVATNLVYVPNVKADTVSVVEDLTSLSSSGGSTSDGDGTAPPTATPELSSGDLLAIGLLPISATLLYRRTRRRIQQMQPTACH